MTVDSALTDAICRAQALVVEGDHEGAEAIYQGLWHSAVAHDDCYTQCVVAHFMAHARRDAESQCRWHLRALHAAEAVGDERVHAFYPSLYANLGDVYLRLGNTAEARAHVRQARHWEHVLPDAGYGWMIRSLIDRLEAGLPREHEGPR